MKNARHVMVFAFGWTLFFILSTGLNYFYSPGDLLDPALFSFQFTAPAVILSIVIWHLTAVIPWPRRNLAVFAIAHAIICALFVVAWIPATIFLIAIMSGVSFDEAVVGTGGYLWRVFVGVWTYGSIMGLSYVLRTRKLLELEEMRTLRAQTLAAEAKLTALRNKMDPHFLFNTLHTIAALVSTDPKLAESAIERLSILLRYVLDESDSKFVTLRNEWSFIEGYWALEKMRLNRPPRFITDISPSALDAIIPPLTLQPLIENTLRHANLSGKEDGYIKTAARIEGQRLIVSVEDNGDGLQDKKVLEIEGAGLGVLRKRIAAIYGGDGLMAVSGNGKKGFLVGLNLPVNGPFEFGRPK